LAAATGVSHEKALQCAKSSQSLGVSRPHAIGDATTILKQGEIAEVLAIVSENLVRKLIDIRVQGEQAPQTERKSTTTWTDPLG
jgi:hypothetical protein